MDRGKIKKNPLMFTLSLMFCNIMATVNEAGFDLDALIDHFRVVCFFHRRSLNLQKVYF